MVMQDYRHDVHDFWARQLAPQSRSENSAYDFSPDDDVQDASHNITRFLIMAREPVNPEAVRYLNRLSDLLFVVARVLARHEGGNEVIWIHGDQRKDS